MKIPSPTQKEDKKVKRSCKDVDITNSEIIQPWVYECIDRHKKRYDFKNLIKSIGNLTPGEYTQLLNGDKIHLEKASKNIAEYAAQKIFTRNLDLKPVKIRLKEDHSTLKVRLIGLESAMQQIYDYICVRSCNNIWERRIVPQQSSSIAQRGPTYGTAMISRWIRKDNRAFKWAKSHNKRYSRKCKYFVKLDIQHCYQSLRVDTFMQYFKRDCGNQDILWLWDYILNSHHVKAPDGNMYHGFMIGALPSQQACQYLLSYLYRFTMNLHKTRRGKQMKLISHMTLFMDDMLLLSNSYKDLKMSVRKLIDYTYKEFGLTIKSNWQICRIDQTPVDMMGYLIHSDGNVTIRPRVFIRIRRLALKCKRKGISLRQAKRICSYKGYLKQNSKRIPLKHIKVYKKYNLSALFEKSAMIISTSEKRKNKILKLEGAIYDG